MSTITTHSAGHPGVTPARANQPALPGREKSTAELHKAAEGFAAVALGEMLAPMFETTDQSGGIFGGGAAEQTWRPMMISEIAKQIAHGGGLGIAEPIYQQMLRLQESRK